MPRRKSEDSNGVQDEQQEDAAAEAEAVETPEAQAEPEYAPEETQTEERAGAPVRRLVKLADRPTMYLVENGKRRPVTESHVAAALLIPVEVVEEDELSEWPEGEPLA